MGGRSSRLRNEVVPIRDLEHWTNKVIHDALVDAIRKQTGRSKALKWQKTKQTKGTKAEVEREVLANSDTEAFSEIPINNLAIESDLNDENYALLPLEVPAPHSPHDSLQLLVSFLNSAVTNNSGKNYIKHLGKCNPCLGAVRSLNTSLGEFFDDGPL